MSPIETEKQKPAYAVIVTLAVPGLVVLLACLPYLVSIAFAELPEGNAADASPIFRVRILPDYKRWKLIAPAEEAAWLDETPAPD